MSLEIQPVDASELAELRLRYLSSMNCQVVHDSIHRRHGWTTNYLVLLENRTIGFATVATAGPWSECPALLEFYLVPEFHTSSIRIFETFLGHSGVQFFEIQSNDVLPYVMIQLMGKDIRSERIVFRDQETTTWQCPAASMRSRTSQVHIEQAILQRSGCGEWSLDVDGREVAWGGLTFHYNPPYCDVYMEVHEEARQRGYGTYFVQELKRLARSLGCIPGARCNPDNIASRRTLQKAGFAPFAHILAGRF